MNFIQLKIGAITRILTVDKVHHDKQSLTTDYLFKFGPKFILITNISKLPLEFRSEFNFLFTPEVKYSNGSWIRTTEFINYLCLSSPQAMVGFGIGLRMATLNNQLLLMGNEPIKPFMVFPVFSARFNIF